LPTLSRYEPEFRVVAVRSPSRRTSTFAVEMPVHPRSTTVAEASVAVSVIVAGAGGGGGGGAGGGG
jgi:hypothetical protein